MNDKDTLILDMIRKAEGALKEAMEDVRTIIEKSEQEESESNPIGHDPDGAYGLHVFSNSPRNGKIKLSATKIDDESRPFYLASGLSFTTEEQAEKAAAGKNAMRELKQAIHFMNNSNGEWFDLDTYQFLLKGESLEYHIVTPLNTNLTFPGANIGKDHLVSLLGEEKIALALEWGM